MKEFTLIRYMMHQRLQIETHTEGDESPEVNMDPVFVVLVMVVLLMPGV